MKINAKKFKLSLSMPSTNTNERTTITEMIKSGELLGGDTWIAIGQNINMREQAHSAGHSCDPTQGGNRVSPMSAHSPCHRFGESHMIAYPNVGKSTLITRFGQHREFVRSSRSLPIGYKISTLRLHWQLYSVNPTALWDREHLAIHISHNR